MLLLLFFFLFLLTVGFELRPGWHEQLCSKRWQKNWKKSSLSIQRPAKGTPAFHKVGGKFLFPTFCSFSFLVLTQGLPQSRHCTATSMIKWPLPQENTEFWAKGGPGKGGPCCPKTMRKSPYFLSVSLFPLFWGQHRFHGTVEKAQEASTPSFWQRKWDKTGHCEPKCDWDTREKRLEVRIAWGLSACSDFRSMFTSKWAHGDKTQRNTARAPRNKLPCEILTRSSFWVFASQTQTAYWRLQKWTDIRTHRRQDRLYSLKQTRLIVC